MSAMLGVGHCCLPNQRGVSVGLGPRQSASLVNASIVLWLLRSVCGGPAGVSAKVPAGVRGGFRGGFRGVSGGFRGFPCEV